MIYFGPSSQKRLVQIFALAYEWYDYLVYTKQDWNSFQDREKGQKSIFLFVIWVSESCWMTVESRFESFINLSIWISFRIMFESRFWIMFELLLNISLNHILNLLNYVWIIFRIIFELHLNYVTINHKKSYVSIFWRTRTITTSRTAMLRYLQSKIHYAFKLS